MENIFFFRSCRIGLYTLSHSFFTILSGFTLVFPCSHWILSIKHAVITSVTGRCSKCKAWNFAAPVIYSQCLIKCFDFFVPAVHSASAEEDRFFFFSPIRLIIDCYLCVWEDHPKWLCILLSRNNSEGIIYKSKLKWKKKCSHLLTVVWFIIYTCTGIRWVSLCVMSHQGCNICLAGFKDVTPPHLARCRQCAPPIRHCFRN